MCFIEILWKNEKILKKNNYNLTYNWYPMHIPFNKPIFLSKQIKNNQKCQFKS